MHGLVRGRPDTECPDGLSAKVVLCRPLDSPERPALTALLASGVSPSSRPAPTAPALERVMWASLIAHLFGPRCSTAAASWMNVGLP